MKPETFDEIVKRKANENVQSRIKVFKNEIIYAFRKLKQVHEDYRFQLQDIINHGPPQNPISGDDKMIINSLFYFEADEKGKYPYPASIWRDEEARVEKQLLDQLDIIQKAMLARPIDPAKDVPSSK